MCPVREIVERAAATDATVLVWGETGVGKECVARMVHEMSPRRTRPFMRVDCAALPHELLESELFGYERGAFTSAHRRKPGRFELAHSGTIFLDEIDAVPPGLQGKLLHALPPRRARRPSTDDEPRSGVRVVAATNKDLGHLTRSGRFREDLFHRLSAVSIHVPPLRARREDIPRLAEYFLDRYAKQYGQPRRALSAEASTHFLTYGWPGNVRELENTIRRIVVLASDDWVKWELISTADPESLPAWPAAPVGAARTTIPSTPGRPERPPDGEASGLRAIARHAALEAQRAVLKAVLDEVRWNRREASRRLKISYKTLRWKIRECGLDDA